MPRTWTCHMQMISNAQTIKKCHYNAPFAEYCHIFEIVTNIWYFSYLYKSFNYIDVLNTLKTEDVLFTLADSNSSALIEGAGDEEAMYVVMPMRL